MCPRCGANIPPGARGSLVCAYCSATLVETSQGFEVRDVFADELLEAPGQPRFWLRGARYRIEGRLGRGETSEVVLARRDHRVGERVVAKVLRAPSDQDRLEAEHDVLVALGRSSARGSSHFTRLLPQPVAIGEARRGLRGNADASFVALQRFESGFVHDGFAVREAYPGGLPVTAAVWMLKRILEILGFVHESGFVHGAVLPRHLLVHARDHGVRLCGFTCAGRTGEPLARVIADAALYPRSAAALTPALDVVMSARAILWLLSDDPRGDPRRAPSGTPAELTRAFESIASDGSSAGAFEALATVDAAARAALGPPRYVPFSMPGWP